MWAEQCFEWCCRRLTFANVLDIGGEAGSHAQLFALSWGKTVDVVDLASENRTESAGLIRRVGSDFMHWPGPVEHYDLVWCSHVLEHQLDVGHFLRKIRAHVKPDGWVAITVPPAKHEIVGGHVSLWNAGLLLYRLVLAGFDCSHAAVKSYGYNISVVVQARYFDLPRLKHDNGDLNTLAQWFPEAARGEGFNGQIGELNWTTDAFSSYGV